MAKTKVECERQSLKEGVRYRIHLTQENLSIFDIALAINNIKFFIDLPSQKPPYVVETEIANVLERAYRPYHSAEA